jgi:hypothetical protein
MKEYLLHLAENMETVHIRFLVLLRSPSEYYKNNQVPSNPYGSILTELRKCFPELSDDAIRAIWNDLYSYGILNTESQYLGALAVSSPGCELLNDRLTEFGKLFLRFITKPS